MLQFIRAAPVLGLAIALASATGANAAPRAESALECGIAADMAVVAHSLAMEEIQRAKADTIMARIYDVSQSDRGKELMKEILDAAYVVKRPTAQEGNAAAGGTASTEGQKFAEDLFATCMKSGGDMDPVLGKKL
jgi:lipopolysaccharide export LptBFGC system permease protein LptF